MGVADVVVQTIWWRCIMSAIVRCCRTVLETMLKTCGSWTQ